MLLVKKYPNRRLYDMRSSRYITLGDLEKVMRAVSGEKPARVLITVSRPLATAANPRVEATRLRDAINDARKVSLYALTKLNPDFGNTFHKVWLTLDQALEGRDLHLDVVDRPRCVGGLDIQDRQLVLLKIYRIVGILQLHLDNRRRQIEDRVEQTDQNDGVFRRPENLLEGKIVGRADSNRHGSVRQKGETQGDAFVRQTKEYPNRSVLSKRTLA